MCKLFKIIQIAHEWCFWNFEGISKILISSTLYDQKIFTLIFQFEKLFQGSSRQQKSNILLPDGNAYWWILIIVVHLWRNFPLSPVLLKKNSRPSLTCVLCFFFCLFIILSCSFFSFFFYFLVLLLTSRFIFCCKTKKKWKWNLNI